MTKEDLYRDIYQYFTVQILFLIRNTNIYLAEEIKRNTLSSTAYYDAYKYLDLYIKILQDTQLALDEQFSKLETYAPDEKIAAEESLSTLLTQLRKRTKELGEK